MGFNDFHVDGVSERSRSMIRRSLLDLLRTPELTGTKRAATAGNAVPVQSFSTGGGSIRASRLRSVTVALMS
jgi:hypothetical protein